MATSEARDILSAWKGELPATTYELSRRHLEAFPGHGDIWILHAASLVDLARYREARAALARALHLTPRPHLHLPHLYLGHLYRAKGDHGRAFGWYERAMLHPGGKARARLFAGEAALLRGQQDAAAEHLGAAARSGETSVAAHHALGKLHRMREDYRKAKRSFERALATNPRHRRSALALRDIDRALRLRENVRSRKGAAGDSRSDDRAALRRVHRARTAELSVTTLFLVEEYLESRPDHWFAWTIRGDMLTDLGRFDDAAVSLRRAVRLAPDDSVHNEQCYLGHLDEARGRYRKAEAWYRQALGGRPSQPSYHVFLGAVLAAQGRFSEAERHHREALRLDASADEPHLNLGYVLRAQGRYGEAERCFERALEIDPRYREARLALKDMRKVLPLVPDDGVSPRRRSVPARHAEDAGTEWASSPD